jgi:tetratricopeptide (TPR) repeat protein
LEKALEAGDKGAEAEARCNLAQLLWMKYEYDASLAQSEQALALARSLDNKPLMARSLSSKAMLYFSRGRLPQVAGLLGEALAVLREIGDRRAQAESLWTLAGTRIWEGAYDEGLTTVDESLALCQELRHGLWLNGCFFLKAMALANEGRFGQALAALDEADKSAEVTGVPYWVPRGYNTRGWIHQELGDLRRALELDKKALQTARESGQIEVEANTLVNLATDYRLLQDHEQSGECLRVAEELVKRQDWCSFRCRTRWLWSLGELSLGQGDHEKALRYAEDMLQLAVSTGQRKNTAKGCKLKGEALAMGGRLDEAMRELEQALDTAEAIGQANLVWQIGHSLGQVCERQGQPGAAKTYYEQAVRTIEQIGGQIGDETLQRSFTISKPVRAVYDSLARLR